MQPALSLRVALVVAVCSLICGCSTPSKDGTAAFRASAKPTPATPAADPASERLAQAHALFARGLIAQDNGSTDQALSWFAKSVEADPGNESLAMEVSRAYYSRHKLAEALAALRGTATRPHASESARTFYAFLLGQAGRADEALAVYRELIASNPDDISLYRSVGAVGAGGGKADTAQRLLDEGVARPGKNPAFWLGLADAYAGLSGTNKPSAALRKRIEAVLAKAAALQPSDPADLQHLGDRYAALGDNAQAEAALERLRKTSPGNPLAAARLAEMYLKEGKSDQARSQLEALVKDNPANPLPHYYLGLLDIQDREYEKAAEEFKRVRLLKVDFEPAYADLAAAQLDLRKPEEAMETLDQATTWFGDSFRRQFLAAIACANLKRFDESMAHYAKAETIARTNDPTALDHRFYFQIGSMLELAGREEESIGYIKKALLLNPDYDEALNHLGYTWAEKGINLDQSRDMIERALKQDPENPAFLDSMGWVLFKLGKPLDALPFLQKASKNMPSPDATVEMHLGDILSALGRKDQAKAAWKRSQTVEDTPEIRSRLSGGP